MSRTEKIIHILAKNEAKKQLVRLQKKLDKLIERDNSFVGTQNKTLNGKLKYNAIHNEQKIKQCMELIDDYTNVVQYVENKLLNKQNET